MRHFTPDDRDSGWARSRGGRLRLGLVVCAVLGAVFGLTSPAASAAPATTASTTNTAAGDWLDVAVGDGHTCAIKADNGLWCWGDNGYGELGNGSLTSSTTPIAVGGASDWTQVRAGVSHTCGIRANGSLWCWGGNYTGQVGDGTTTARSTPTQVGTSTAWTSLSAGSYHNCALRTDGSLWCWGSSGFGQIGDGSVFEDVLTPTQIGAGATWKSVDAGDRHTCAVRTNGTLWCWGTDRRGVLGIGNSPGTGQTEALPVQVGTSTDWSTASAGGTHTCGLRTSGALWCWGEGLSGQIGDNATTARWSPVRVGTETSWQQVTTGDTHTCARKANTTLWCWGNNFAGSLGLGPSDTNNRDEPAQVGWATAWETGWTTVVAGGYTTCGLRDGSLYCWGDNDEGQVGDGTTIDKLVPFLIS